MRALRPFGCSEFCRSGLDVLAERRPVLAPDRIEALRCPSRLAAPDEGSTSGLANNQLIRFQNAQGLAQRSQAHAEFPVQIHLAWKQSTRPELARSYAVQHRIAHLQV